MKELFNYCSQPRAYADSVGHCLVEMEENETIQDVKKEYASGSGWWERKYSSIREVSEYTHNNKEYKGRLALMNTKSAYTG